MDATDAHVVVALPNEMLAQLVQNNTELTRCLTRLMDHLEDKRSQQQQQQQQPPPYEADADAEAEADDVIEYDGTDELTAAAASFKAPASCMDMIGTLVNAFVIAAIFVWFLDLIGRV
jgi:lipid II:glycine glycyltransferase (peptidoglycan interpeptide bridge formation enzyme)